jgi:hypothetical protein
MIKAACWESKFKCKGVADLAAFNALVVEIETADPVVSAVMSIDRSRDGSVPPFLLPPNVVLLSRRLDAVLDLLEATTDALAALDQATEASEASEFGFPSVIQRCASACSHHLGPPVKIVVIRQRDRGVLPHAVQGASEAMNRATGKREGEP